MNNTTMKPLIIMAVAVIVSLGAALGGFFVSQSMGKPKARRPGIVRVKGFSERKVRSDLGELILNFRTQGNDLAEIQEKNDQEQKDILVFLKSKGIKDEEISPNEASLSDHWMYAKGKKNEYHYTLVTRLKIITAKLDVLEEIASRPAELLERQVSSSSIRYYFTRYADLRTEMIAEATQSARQAALQFAKDSGSRVKEIRNAKVFSIPKIQMKGDFQKDKEFRVTTRVAFNLVDQKELEPHSLDKLYESSEHKNNEITAAQGFKR